MVHAGEDDSFTLQTDCSAGLLAMLVVCARSTSLRGELDLLERSWVSSPRVVVEEGPVLADYMEPMDARYEKLFCFDIGRINRRLKVKEIMEIISYKIMF